MNRLFDICAAGVGVSLLFSLLVVLASIARFKFGSSILSSPTRLGLHGKPFTMYKFRTVNNDEHGDAQLLCDAERLEAFGMFPRNNQS